jgi:hypothetical protein
LARSSAALCSAACLNPAFLVARLVRGVPLSYELVRESIPARVDEIGAEPARFHASFHHPEVLALARERLDRPLRTPEPGLQATTDELRARLTPVIEPQQRDLVHCWCDSVDEQLARGSDPVFVHGDFHGYNQLWDQRTLRLRLVADFDTSGAAEAEYDFRVIPAMGSGDGSRRRPAHHNDEPLRAPFRHTAEPRARHDIACPHRSWRRPVANRGGAAVLARTPPAAARRPTMSRSCRSASRCSGSIPEQHRRCARPRSAYRSAEPRRARSRRTQGASSRSATR